MRRLLLLTPAAALLFAGSLQASVNEFTPEPVYAVAAAAPVTATAQPPQGQIDIDVGIEDEGGPWYTNPLWIVVGMLALIVFALVVGLSARGGPRE